VACNTRKFDAGSLGGGGELPIETAMDGIAAARARIAEIESLFATGAARGGQLGAGASQTAETVSFAAALEDARAAGGADAPDRAGTPNKAGVDPVRWARDFLTRLGMPVTSENVRAVVAWEQAEGTAARFNPLATTQPGFPGSTNFNSVGVKNFATYEDGLAANVKVIQNGLYGNILAALRKGTSAEEVARAIADSPWGSGDLVLKILGSPR
jgi:hypothetical protein